MPEYTIEDPDVTDVRVDIYLAEHEDLLPRSQLKARIISLEVNGKSAKLSRRVSTGDTISVEIASPPDVSYAPEPIPLDIIYEDTDCIVVNKARGMVVHPAAGVHSGTLVQALLYHCTGLADQFDSNIRPGIVHRLDKDTTGVLIAAKHPEAQEFLSRQFRTRLVAKRYYAAVKGCPQPRVSKIERAIHRDPRNRKRFYVTTEGGKPALTNYHVLHRYERYSFVALEPHTGRTHQLRVHLKSIGTPILGDPIYTRSDAAFPQAPLMLHAYALTIQLPGTDRPSTFRAPLPADFKAILRGVAK